MSNLTTRNPVSTRGSPRAAYGQHAGPRREGKQITSFSDVPLLTEQRIAMGGRRVPSTHGDFRDCSVRNLAL